MNTLDENTSINQMLNLISSRFIDTVSEYDDKEKAATLIGSLILSDLNSLKKIKELK